VIIRCSSDLRHVGWSFLSKEREKDTNKGEKVASVVVERMLLTSAREGQVKEGFILGCSRYPKKG
jgi:hypothetical protein